MINEVITRLAEQPNVGGKAVFEAAAGVAERATLGTRTDAVEPVIEIRKGRVDRLPIPARENRTEPTEDVGRQVNPRPEVIQREPQHDVCGDDARRRTERAASARDPGASGTELRHRER